MVNEPRHELLMIIAAALSETNPLQHRLPGPIQGIQQHTLTSLLCLQLEGGRAVFVFLISTRFVTPTAYQIAEDKKKRTVIFLILTRLAGEELRRKSG